MGKKIQALSLLLMFLTGWEKDCLTAAKKNC